MAELRDDGLVTVCTLENMAESGDMPVYRLIGIFTQYYGERQISLTRSYLARGVDEQVDMVIRIADDGYRPRIGQFAVLRFYSGQENDAGDQYRITLVQPLTDEDGLRCYDLTLSRMEENYDAVIPEA